MSCFRAQQGGEAYFFQGQGSRICGSTETDSTKGLYSTESGSVRVP